MKESFDQHAGQSPGPSTGSRQAAGGAEPRQSEVEAGAQCRAHGVGGAPEPCRGNDAGRFPHAGTLAPHDALVIA